MINSYRHIDIAMRIHLYIYAANFKDDHHAKCSMDDIDWLMKVFFVSLGAKREIELDKIKVE